MDNADVLDVHFNLLTASEARDRVNEFSQFGKPLIVTEWSGKQLGDMRGVWDVLDGRVEAACYALYNHNQSSENNKVGLVRGDNTLSEFGLLFKELR